MTDHTQSVERCRVLTHSRRVRQYITLASVATAGSSSNSSSGDRGPAAIDPSALCEAKLYGTQSVCPPMNRHITLMYFLVTSPRQNFSVLRVTSQRPNSFPVLDPGSWNEQVWMRQAVKSFSPPSVFHLYLTTPHQCCSVLDHHTHRTFQSSSVLRVNVPVLLQSLIQVHGKNRS